MSRPDASEAIAHALEMSKKYGGSSKEAAAAWDIVEELDASDNSASYKGGESDARVSYDKNFNAKLKELADILQENEEKVKKIKAIVSDIQAIKLSKPTGAVAPNTEALKSAMKEAKEITEKHGIDSVQARQAWETVEEIASADNSTVGAPDLDDECLIEALDACEALEEINRLAALQRFDGSRYSG